MPLVLRPRRSVGLAVCSGGRSVHPVHHQLLRMAAEGDPAAPLGVDQIASLVGVVFEVEYPNNTPVGAFCDDFHVLVPRGTLVALVEGGVLGVLVPEEHAGGVVVVDGSHGGVVQRAGVGGDGGGVGGGKR